MLAKIGLLEVVETETFPVEEVEVFAKGARVARRVRREAERDLPPTEHDPLATQLASRPL